MREQRGLITRKETQKMSSTMWKKAKPYFLTIAIQFGSAGMYIISTVTLNHGMNRYVLIVYRNAIAALILAPFALVLERKTRPKMTISIFLHIMVLGFLEPVLDQGFAYLGMKYTSASFTSAIMNAVPSVTFVISVIFRIEHVNIKEVRSQAKVIGTIVTFGGALLMAMYKGPAFNLVGSHDTGSNHESSNHTSNTHWAMGTLFILIGCVAWSCFYVLQSVTLKKYPANISLSCLICLMGAMQGSTVAFVAERHPSAWAVGWDTRLLAPLYTGIVSSGVTYYVQGLVMKTTGPVFVTAFNPLCMILVAILASFILAEKLHLGSIIGGFIIAIGLYAVVWGKSKDYSSSPISPTDLKDDDEAHKLPITTATSGTKLNIDKSSSTQPAEMHYTTVQK